GTAAAAAGTAVAGRGGRAAEQAVAATGAAGRHDILILDHRVGGRRRGGGEDGITEPPRLRDRLGARPACPAQRQHDRTGHPVPAPPRTTPKWLAVHSAAPLATGESSRRVYGSMRTAAGRALGPG